MNSSGSRLEGRDTHKCELEGCANKFGSTKVREASKKFGGKAASVCVVEG